MTTKPAWKTSLPMVANPARMSSLPPNGGKASDYDRCPNNDEPREDVESAESESESSEVYEDPPQKEHRCSSSRKEKSSNKNNKNKRPITMSSTSKKQQDIEYKKNHHLLKIMLLSLLAWKWKPPITCYLPWNNLMLTYPENNQRSIFFWTQETEKYSGNLLE